MPLATHPPETDLIMPLPGPGESWDPHTIHTHYFGFCVPEAAIGVFAYVRAQPYFPLCQGGVVVFQGLDNVTPLDAAHVNFEATMPWPTLGERTVETANGLHIEFVELGRVVRLTYGAPDGSASFEVLATGVTPLIVRGHVMPGEEAHHGDPSRVPGGSEQFMHLVGELKLHGESYPVDCYYPRDRSWRQVRVETRNNMPIPPIGWSPMCFWPDLIFNQICYEAPDTDPAWLGIYDMPADRPTHHFAWLHQGDKTLDIVRVRRNVLERDPRTYAALRQEIEAEDETGAIHRFAGEAIASALAPAWPNVSFHDNVYRWTDEAGRVTYCTFQEIWFEKYQWGLRARAAGSR